MSASGGSTSDQNISTNKVVDGQNHYLAYITPDEGKSLVNQGGKETITDSGIPAYPGGGGTPGGYDGGSDSSSNSDSGGWDMDDTGGADDNSSSGCVVATHAVNAGVFDLSTKREAIRWCVKNLHRTWWGEAIRRGYRYYGQKAIDQGTVKKHYQEFKNYLAFATGKKRNLKNTWTFLYRTIQFFIKGITI